MADDMIRTEIELPREVIETIDRLAGAEGRGRFIAQAAEEKARRDISPAAAEESARTNGKAKVTRGAESDHDPFLAALDRVAGTIRPGEVPEWETPEKTSEWVRAIRREADESTERKLRRWNED